jgi:hypothetical protein
MHNPRATKSCLVMFMLYFLLKYDFGMFPIFGSNLIREDKF